MVFSAFRPTRTEGQARQRSFWHSLRVSYNDAALKLPKSRESGPSKLQTFSQNTFTESNDAMRDSKQLNNCLAVLATLFPDVRPEVFREMLSTFSEESRLHITVEQLLKHESKWVNGRWRSSLKEHGSTQSTEVFEFEQASKRLDSGGKHILISLEETFRTESYKRATRAALYQEFKSLSRSTIEGVLAEKNFSYTAARPVLLHIMAKSWRIDFSTLLSKWRKPSLEISEQHFMILWTKASDKDPVSQPYLRETGNEELNTELYTKLLQPLLKKTRDAQEMIDLELATLLNEQEAEQSQALYECECCFSDTTFESLATCTTGTHQICYNCIHQAVSAALFGQSWGLNVDHVRCQIACLAPTSSGPCDGCIPHDLARRAVLTGPKGGAQLWKKLESRLADEALVKSQVLVVRCPFCNYAELDDLYLPGAAENWRLDDSHFLRTLFLLCLSINFLPLIFLYFLLSHVLSLLGPSHLLQSSFTSLRRKTHLSPRFTCRSPSCLRLSCLDCRKPWRDPHTCHELAASSLRTTIEAARTAALKRICPCCGLGFVKDSGCNKMVCICGYSMCYICRQGLGRRPGTARHGIDLLRRPDLRGNYRGEDITDEGEGYQHFCQHFRPAGGGCTECDKCDLYREGDDDEIVVRAGERAEKEWREREGIEQDVMAVPGGRTKITKSWSLQDAMDWWVGKIIKF